jgi:hypothetical protein
MAESASQRLYSQDAEVLGQIGAVLVKTDLPRVEVRLPRPLAEQALGAWQRKGEEGPAEPETFEQRMHRHRAAALGLIGLSIETDGRWHEDYVTVGLSPDLIGDAFNAADDLRP